MNPEMVKYPKIGQLRNMWAHLQRNYPQLNHIDFVATVKLHGTNAGIFVGDGELIPQGRNRRLTPEKDNFGFASWVKENEKKLLRWLRRKVGTTVYGEWVGKGIQKGVAVSEIERCFVCFDTEIGSLPSIGLRSVHDAGARIRSLRVSYPQEFQDQINELVEQVDKECLWAKAVYGISGTGEGWVFKPLNEELRKDTGLWFKAKGESHQKNYKKPKQLNPDAGKIAEFARTLITPERLKQGMDYFQEMDLDRVPQNIPEYLKFIGNDIKTEEADVIEESGFDWKTISRTVNKLALEYYKECSLTF